MEERWEKINSGDINESVLKEELSARVRRRVTSIDWQIEFAVKEVKRQNNVCSMREDDFIETVIEKTIDSMYWDFFSDMDENTPEWGASYQYILKYAEDKFTNKLKEYYHIKCGD
jgi:hypothetical protein